MKKIVFFLAVLCCTLSCKNDSNKTSSQTYTINGVVKDIKDGDAYIQIINSTEAKPDTVNIANGNFIYKGKANTPELAIMLIASKNGQLNSKNVIVFFNEPGSNINITIDSTAKEKVAISGSKTNDEFKLFKEKNIAPIEELEKKAFANVNPMSVNNAKLMDSLMSLAKSLEQKKKAAILEYAKTNKNSVVAIAYAYLISMQDADTKFIQSVYNEMGDDVKQTFYGVEFKKKIDIAGKTEIGATAIDFTLPNADGKSIKLSDFYKGKKLVLIDFWASWCGPCRKENPNVVKAYNKFNSKGFEILGVSLDEDKTEWLDAIKKDNLSWTQVSDLKGWASDVARLYDISAIPTNFLIDGNGKILASNLRGEDLELKLASLLK